MEESGRNYGSPPCRLHLNNIRTQFRSVKPCNGTPPCNTGLFGAIFQLPAGL
jgi:hypothetical protein